MKDHRRQIRNREFWILFLVNILLFSAVYFLSVFVKHFSVDDYYAHYSQFSAASDAVSMSYRNCYWLFVMLLDHFQINVVEHQIFFGCILVFTFAWCTTVITMEVYSRICQGRNICMLCFIDMGALFLWVNAFISEWLWFSLADLQWIAAVIGITYAAVAAAKKENIRKNWLIAFVWLFLAAGSYQTALADYAFLVMFFIFVDAGGRIQKESICATIRAALAAVLSIALNMLLTNALSKLGLFAMQSRMRFDLSQTRERLRLIYDFQKGIWIDGLGLLPKYSALLVLILLLGILAAAAYKRMDALSGLYVAILLLSGQCVMYLPELIGGEWMHIRLLVPVFGIYAVLIWLICYYTAAGCRIHKYCCRAAQCLCAVFLFVNILCIQENALDGIRTNTLDQYCIGRLNDYITNYEQNAHTQIRSVGFCYDASLTYRYDGHIKNECGDLAIRAFAREWSRYPALVYYTGRNLELISVPEKTAAGFAGQDWSRLDLDQQVIFDGDKMYICIY